MAAPGGGGNATDTDCVGGTYRDYVEAVVVMALTVVVVIVTIMMANVVVLLCRNDACGAAETDCGAGACRGRG